MSGKTTVDNLPVNVSNQYAIRDKNSRDPFNQQVRGSSSSPLTKVDVFVPSQGSLLTRLTGTIDIANSVATFSHPDSAANPLFTYQLVPSLGDPAVLDNLHQKLHDYAASLVEGTIRDIDHALGTPDFEAIHWRLSQLSAEHQENAGKIQSLISTLQELGSILNMVNARRKMYTQG